ncbi:hypothetical protein ACSQ67_025801 [Phaseolus vulgaris]
MIMKNLKVMTFMVCMVLKDACGEHQIRCIPKERKHSSNSRLSLSMAKACSHLGPLPIVASGGGFAAATSLLMF